MIQKVILPLLSFLFLISCTQQEKTPVYPQIAATPVTDTYHGVTITDPYRNLEDLEDTTVVSWLQEQGNYAADFLSRIPGQTQLIETQKKIAGNKEFRITAAKRTYDNHFFYKKTITGDSITKLYRRKGVDGPEELLFDPSTYKSGYRINYHKPDWKGEKVAISLADKGEEISEIIVFDVATKTIIAGPLKNAKPSTGGIYWLPDNTGFTYIYHPNTNPQKPEYTLNSKSLLHTIGSYPNVHVEVFSKSNNPEVGFQPEDFPKIYIYEDYYPYVFGQVGGSSRFKDVYYKPTDQLSSSHTPWQLLHKQSDKVLQIDLQGDDLIFLSAKNASNYQICKTPIQQPNFKNPEIIIPEDSTTVITDFTVSKDGIFFVREKNGVEAKLYRYGEGQEKEITLPKPSSAIEISSFGYNKKNITVYADGWLQKRTRYIYDYQNNEFINSNLTPAVENTQLKDLIIKEIEVPSHDGVMVPLSIIHPKDIALDGKNPTLLCAYGSYGAAGTPYFSPSLLTWAAEGGVLVVAHVRGGGEKGDAWHMGGYKTTKPNTWKDMIACTEYMIEKGYTSPHKTALFGSSAGGIMAGRAMTERPDLYKAVLLMSPAINMLRCEIQPNGLNSIKEFGTVKKEDEFKALLEMDAYHHIEKGITYPATLVTAGMKDGRVVIWDPAKFVARLQANNSSDVPILFSVDFDAGHSGMSNSREKFYKMLAELYAFAFWQTGHPGYQPE